jgi:hypothetical protein
VPSAKRSGWCGREGPVIVDAVGGPVEILDAVEARFVGELPDRRPPTSWTPGMTGEAFARRGCHIGDLPQVRLEFACAPPAFLARLERGQAWWRWALDPATFGPAAARVRAWAEAEFGSLDQLRDLSTTVRMHACTVGE